MSSHSRQPVRVLILAVLTETLFALLLFFGQAPDVKQGDWMGWVGWLAHLPAALAFNLASPIKIYSDVPSAGLYVIGLLQWLLLWTLSLVVLPKLSARSR